MLLLGSHLGQPGEMAQHRKVAFLFGLIQGAALQIKFLTAPETAFLGLVFGLVVLSERRRLLDGVQLFASFIAAFLLPTLLVFAWFWRIGALHEMVLANFISPAYYAKSAFGLADPDRLAEGDHAGGLRSGAFDAGGRDFAGRRRRALPPAPACSCRGALLAAAGLVAGRAVQLDLYRELLRPLLHRAGSTA